MTSLTLGPFAVPIERIVLIAAVVAALLALRWFKPADRRALESSIWIALVAGLLGARLAYVVLRWEAFRGEAWRALALWEDGYEWSTGIVVGLVAAAVWADRTRQRVVRLAVPAMAGALVWIVGSALVDGSQRDRFAALPTDVVLQDLGGAAVVPGAFVGKPTVVNLWATWCPPCRREMPVLAAAQQQRPDLNFVFVNQGEGATAIRRYLGASGLAVEQRPARCAAGVRREGRQRPADHAVLRWDRPSRRPARRRAVAGAPAGLRRANRVEAVVCALITRPRRRARGSTHRWPARPRARRARRSAARHGCRAGPRAWPRPSGSSH